MANWWNLPNALTIGRVLLVPLFVWLMFAQADAGSTALRWAAFAVFAGAMVTDVIDGYVARAMNLITAFGKLLDPIADKALVGAALVTLSCLGEVPWWVTILIIAREVLITVARLCVAAKVVVAADWQGKVKTLAQTIGLGILVSPWGADVGWFHVCGLIVLFIALVLTWTSGIQYLRGMARAMRSGK